MPGWFDCCDVRALPLVERKWLPAGMVPSQPAPVLDLYHVAKTGVELHGAVCATDMKGIVAKLANAPYTRRRPLWAGSQLTGCLIFRGRSLGEDQEPGVHSSRGGAQTSSRGEFT